MDGQTDSLKRRTDRQQLKRQTAKKTKEEPKRQTDKRRAKWTNGRRVLTTNRGTPKETDKRMDSLRNNGRADGQNE